MIKSLLDADENPPPDTRVIIEETTVEQPQATTPAVVNAVADENIFTSDQIKEVEDILEIPASSQDSSPNEIGVQTNAEAVSIGAPNSENSQSAAEIVGATFDAPNETHQTTLQTDSTIFQTAYEPETQAETMRKSGLAYAAAITLFGAVVFMMILGWGFDLLFGSSPWGIVGGIVVGALIGFVQFFRLSSQIFK